MRSIKGILDILEKAQEFKNRINPLDKKNSLRFSTRIQNNQNTNKALFKNLTIKNNINNLDLDKEDKIINSTMN